MKIVDLVTIVGDCYNRSFMGSQIALRMIVDRCHAHVNDLALFYAEEPPAGAEAVRDLMLEALENLVRCLDEIDSFLAAGDLNHLSQARVYAETGDDLLLTVQYEVQYQKDSLAAISAAA